MRAVVLAAGEGRRNRPLTRTRPKVMLPVANRPILEHVLASLHRAEVRDVTVVVGYKAETIQTHLQDGARFGVRIRYVEQRGPKGSIEALARGVAAGPKDEDVLVVPGDNYVGPDVLRRFLAAAGTGDALLYTTTADPTQYGVVELNDDFVSHVREKPSSPEERTVSTGIARLTPESAATAKRYTGSPETGFSDLLDALARSKTRLRAVPVEGPWFDVDRPESLLGANALELADLEPRVDGVVEPGASLVGAVHVAKGARIRSGSYLVGPIVVGEGCEVGPHTVVYGPSAIGENATVGPFTELMECVVMNDVRIASGCTLHHAVLDRGVVLASRVNIDKAHGLGPAFGAVVGDGTTLGNQVTLLPGSIVGAQVNVAAGKRVGSLRDGSKVV